MSSPVIRLFDMVPLSYYADGDPVYRNGSGGLPSRGVRALPTEYDTQEQAYAAARAYVDQYEAADRLGNMGIVLGVQALQNGKFRGVVNTYHSNT